MKSLFVAFLFLLMSASAKAQLPDLARPHPRPHPVREQLAINAKPGIPIPAKAATLAVIPPALKPAVETSAFSLEFIHSVFPTKQKPGFMPVIAGKELVCHGFGTQGGQYACYAAHGDISSVDCFFDRYMNETPVAQACGQFKLPANSTKALTSETTIK